MRICFVPCCDQTRLSAKCMMFMPPKTPEMFERWHSVLPKHRNFKPTDRVCERHFQPGDIQTTWDHIINGKLVQLERNKPMLMPNAVPTLNLQLGAPRGVARSANNSNRRTRDGVAMKRKKPTATTNVDAQHPMIIRKIKVAKVDDAISTSPLPEAHPSEDHIEIIFDIHPESEPQTINASTAKADDDGHTALASHCENAEDLEVLDDQLLEADEVQEDAQPEDTAIAMPQHEYLHEDEDATNADVVTDNGEDGVGNDEDADDASFEQLFDDIYEVILPDTMYGVHRDPERTFIVFSLFDAVAMRSSKVLRIDQGGRRARTFIDGIQCTDCRLPELSTDLVTAKLAELDTWRLCRQMAGRPKRRNGSPAEISEKWDAKCLRYVADGEGDVCASCA